MSPITDADPLCQGGGKFKKGDRDSFHRVAGNKKAGGGCGRVGKRDCNQRRRLSTRHTYRS